MPTYSLNITPAQVIELAFVRQQMKTEFIKPVHILLAQINYMKPALSALYDLCMVATPTPTIQALCHDYLLTPLAFYVKYQVLPEIYTQITNMGAMQPNEQFSSMATNRDKEMLREQVMQDANSLMKLAFQHIEDNPTLFPTYEPIDNASNRILHVGGIIFPKTNNQTYYNR